MSQTTASKTGKRVPFGLKDKLAYAAGDFGCNMSFALKSYLTIYWTQYMGYEDEDGITTMSIYDFLLNENSLNL